MLEKWNAKVSMMRSANDEIYLFELFCESRKLPDSPMFEENRIIQFSIVFESQSWPIFLFIV